MSIKRIGVLLLCALLVAGLLSACDKDESPPTATPTPPSTPSTPAGTTEPPPEPAQEFVGIDFSNGNIDFLALYAKPADASPDTTLELADYNGGKAAKITPAGKSVPYVVIDASSLLGARVTDLYTLEVTVAVENPDGEFQAVSGEIIAYSGADRTDTKGAWSVYLDYKNPNIARMTLDTPEKRFIPDAYNFFIINRKVDNAITAEQTPGDLYITHIGFLDESGKYIPVDDNAVFDEPPGFTEMGMIVPVKLGEMNCVNSATQMGWLTDGVDGIASPHTAETFAAAVSLTLEFAEPPTGGMQLIWLGDGDGWTWNQAEGIIPDGGMDGTTLTIDLPSTLINYDAFTISTNIKLLLGYYSDNIEDLGIVDAYLNVYKPVELAIVKLGEMNNVNSDTQMGWLTDGVDNKESPYTAGMFANAVSLILEFAEPPTGGMQVIWQGDGDGWSWNQTDGVIPDGGMDGTTLTIDLPSTLENYDAFTQSTQIKFFLGYYDDNIADLGIVSAYLKTYD